MHMQQWTDSKGASHSGKVPAFVDRLIEAIGLDATVTLILEMGGATIYVAADPQIGARLESAIGAEAVRKLASAMPGGDRWRVPLAPKFLARHLRAQGLPIQEIARQLRRADVSVKNWLKPDAAFDRVKALKEAEALEYRAETLRMAAQE